MSSNRPDIGYRIKQLFAGETIETNGHLPKPYRSSDTEIFCNAALNARNEVRLLFINDSTNEPCIHTESRGSAVNLISIP
jgi:hypothetical protein